VFANQPNMDILENDLPFDCCALTSVTKVVGMIILAMQNNNHIDIEILSK
jgi:hypothetical protein